MTDEEITIRTADGREIALGEATWADLEGTWEPDGSEELPPPLPLVTLTHEMTRRPGAAQYAGQWYHADRDEYTAWLECVLLLRRRSRALFAKGEERPVCASNNGDNPMPNQPVWLSGAPERWQTTNGNDVFMVPIREQWPDGPVECRECPFAGHLDPDTNEYSTGLCRSSVQFLAMRTGSPDLCIVRLSSSQARGLERFIRQRMRSRNRPLFSMRLAIETKRVVTRDRNHAYELVVAGEDLPVGLAVGYQEIVAAHRDRFGGEAVLAAPAADSETGEVQE